MPASPGHGRTTTGLGMASRVHYWSNEVLGAPAHCLKAMIGSHYFGNWSRFIATITEQTVAVIIGSNFVP